MRKQTLRLNADLVVYRSADPLFASEVPLYGLNRIANVYLHYVFDLWADVWADVWRRKAAKGDVIIVRYADDLALGLQLRADAMRFLEEFKERLAKFGLELHPEKTRLIEFGR